MITQTVMKLQASLVALMLVLFLLPLDAAHAGSAAEIDASIDTALRQFKEEVKGDANIWQPIPCSRNSRSSPLVSGKMA